MASDLKIKFSLSPVSALDLYAPIYFAHKFSKEKKEKKKAVRSSGGFQKSKFFFKKYYPIYHRNYERKNWDYISCDTLRVEIFSKTRRA
jgi:hypothetical protein